MRRLPRFSELGRLRLALPVLIGLLVWAVLPSLSLSGVSASDDFPTPTTGTQLHAALTGSPIGGVQPFGFANYFETGTHRALSVSATQVNLPGGTVLDVSVADTSVGHITLGMNHAGFLVLDTGHGDTVPTVAAGAAIAITSTSAGSGTTTTVLSGTFMANPTPSPSGSPTTSPSPTGSTSPSPHPSYSPSPHPSYSPSPHPSYSPSPHPSPSASASPSGSPTPSPSPFLPRIFFARLNGAQEVPAVQTNARGFGLVTVNQAGTQMTVHLAFRNLSSAETGASINGPAMPGETGPVVFDLGTLGGTSGNLPVATLDIDAAQLALLRAGQLYFNIASTDHADGEIRGQIIPVMRNHSCDFDGDGRADLSVFRPSSGSWYIRRSLDSGISSQQWSWASQSKFFPGDYDGDGKTDVAVFNPVNSTWRYQQSSDGTLKSQVWGMSGDIPVNGDFDGDGVTDISVFRPSNGTWYILNSSDGSWRGVQWGFGSDKVVPGDYDGDGVTDIAVFRPSNGTWYIHQSFDDSFRFEQWGVATDQAVPGDYDGDGITDIAVFRPSTGYWYIHQSSNGSLRYLQWGISTDKAVSGDFDGDGVTDIAVFRQSNGTWYIMRSTDGGLQTEVWGTSGDVPGASHLPD